MGGICGEQGGYKWSQTRECFPKHAWIPIKSLTALLLVKMAVELWIRETSDLLDAIIFEDGPVKSRLPFYTCASLYSGRLWLFSYQFRPLLGAATVQQIYLHSILSEDVGVDGGSAGSKPRSDTGSQSESTDSEIANLQTHLHRLDSRHCALLENQTELEREKCWQSARRLDRLWLSGLSCGLRCGVVGRGAGRRGRKDLQAMTVQMTTKSKTTEQKYGKHTHTCPLLPKHQTHQLYRNHRLSTHANRSGAMGADAVRRRRCHACIRSHRARHSPTR
jgi:hypothetical protein